MAFKDCPTTNFEPREVIPAGMHIARCYSIVDMGTQPGSLKFPEPKRKIYITWELPEQTDEFDGVEKPLVVGNSYNAAFGEKANLSIMLKNWFADKQPDGDMVAWLDRHCAGRPALINIVHNKKEDRTFANIATVSPLPEKLLAGVAEQFNPSVVFEMFGQKFPQDEFDKIPKWLQDKIKTSPEFRKYFGGGSQPGFDENEDSVLPF